MKQKLGPEAHSQFIDELQNAVSLIPPANRDTEHPHNNIEKITEKVMEYYSVLREY